GPAVSLPFRRPSDPAAAARRRRQPRRECHRGQTGGGDERADQANATPGPAVSLTLSLHPTPSAVGPNLTPDGGWSKEASQINYSSPALRGAARIRSRKPPSAPPLTAEQITVASRFNGPL